MAKKLAEKKTEVTADEHKFGEGFLCKACDHTGLNPITKELCSVCGGTPEK